MPAYNPPVNGVAYVTYICLADMANPGAFKANPTIAAGDFKVSIDDGALNNLATLPSVSPAGSIWVKIELSAGEMTGDNIKLQAIDQTATKEWADDAWTFQTVAAAPATAAALAAIQADTDNIQTRLPAALVGGRMDSDVGNMQSGVITAAAVATDAIDSDALAANAIADIQAGLATAASIVTAQADLDNIQTRLPAALVGGRMDSDIGAVQANAITAASLAPDVSAEIADRLLGRNHEGGSDGGRTVTEALQPSRNKTEVVAGVLTVYESDDVTPSWTAAVTTAAGNPISAIDPA